MNNESTQGQRSDGKDAREGKCRRVLVLLDGRIADARQILDDLFGAFAR